MKPEPHFLPPRSRVLFSYTRSMLDSTSMCVRKFGMAVAERYMQLAAPDQRQVPFRWGVTIDDLCKAERHNAQILGRYMDGTVKTLPADLEDAWVLALPEPFRSDCEKDLARRRGRYSFELPEGGAGEDLAAIGGVMKEAGELFAAWGSAAADGQITDAEFSRVEREIDDVIASLLALRAYARDRSKQDAAQK